MTDDILSRLRFCADLHSRCGQPENARLFSEAATEIERLRWALRRIEEKNDT